MSKTSILISLDEDVVQFLDKLNQVDPSALINRLFRQEIYRRHIHVDSNDSRGPQDQVTDLWEEHLEEDIPAAG